MAELLNHRHCKNCDRATTVDQELCSPECEATWAAFQKKRRRTVLSFYVVSAVLVTLLVLQLAKYYQ